MPSRPHEVRRRLKPPNQRVIFSCPNDTMPRDLVLIAVHRFRTDYAGERFGL